MIETINMNTTNMYNMNLGGQLVELIDLILQIISYIKLLRKAMGSVTPTTIDYISLCLEPIFIFLVNNLPICFYLCVKLRSLD